MKSIRFGHLAGALGCVFALQFPTTAAAQAEKVVYSFGSNTTIDSADPFAGLTDVNGVLYGTTAAGGGPGCGALGCGTVFAVHSSTGVETVLYAFCSQQNCEDGYSPKAGLLDLKGTLYGTTNKGGAHGGGAVFALDPKTGAETVVYAFCSRTHCTDGKNPMASVIDAKGMLYGTTQSGGVNDGGTVFALDPSTGTETTLYSFCNQPNCTDGKHPMASVLDAKGVLYGTTVAGGAAGDGTVFALDPKTGAETVVYSFCNQSQCTDGKFPAANVIDVKGVLYGTTQSGGVRDGGTVFALNPSTGAETILYSFCSQQNCTDGRLPAAALIDLNGTLYGTTYRGGAADGGTAFALDPSTGVETVLHSFCKKQNCDDGQHPVAGLTNVNGALYGTTELGGTFGLGTVFVFDEP